VRLNPKKAPTIQTHQTVSKETNQCQPNESPGAGVSRNHLTASGRTQRRPLAPSRERARSPNPRAQPRPSLLGSHSRSGSRVTEEHRSAGRGISSIARRRSEMVHAPVPTAPATYGLPLILVRPHVHDRLVDAAYGHDAQLARSASRSDVPTVPSRFVSPRHADGHSTSMHATASP
jgi:hypothetical protein